VGLPIADHRAGLGAAAGVLATVAVDLVLMAQTEVGEMAEVSEGRGGSSAIPHKNNPVAAISARACARRAPGLVATLLASMEQEHERAAGAWHAEWPTLADLLVAVGSAAAWLAESLRSLRLDTARMAATVDHARETLLAYLPPDVGEAGRQVDKALAEHERFVEGAP
jgi:3-carboxy-cis,cis-muconate cycloisomerase